MDRSIVPVEEPLVVGTQLGSLLVQGLDEPLEGVYGLDTIDGGALRCDPDVKQRPLASKSMQSHEPVGATLVLHVVPVLGLLDDILDLHLGQGVVREDPLALLGDICRCAART